VFFFFLAIFITFILCSLRTDKTDIYAWHREWEDLAEKNIEEVTELCNEAQAASEAENKVSSIYNTK